jgi:hypothetical protein
MPQAAATAPQPPQPPAAPSSPGATVVDGSGQVFSAQPITREQADFLRTRRDALSNQLESATERRDEVAEQLRSENTTAAERPGLQDRLRVLDERLVQLEKDIAINSEQLANAPSSRRDGTTAARGSDRGGFPMNVNGNLIVIFSFALLMPFAIQLARRMFAPDRAPSRRELADLSVLQDRRNKMESSIDAVAIEVERIGEGQRFLTQAMVGGSLPAGAPAFEGVQVREQQGAERR